VEETINDQDVMDQDIVLALAASPDFAHDGICFAARRSGLHVSDDGGQSFAPTYDSLNLQTELPTLAVALSPSFRSDHTVFAGAEGGILRSFDGGKTWWVELFKAPAPMISALAVSPAYEQDGTVFAATMQDGVYRSGDRGGSWQLWNFGLLDLQVLSLAISPNFAVDDTLYVGTESGVFRSTNGARAWREMSFPADCAPVISLALAPDYAQSNVLYAGTESMGLWRSPDRGRTWERIGEDAIDGPVNAICAGGPADLLVLLEDTVLVSHDAGGTWAACESGDALTDGAACIAVPQGLAPGAPLLVGLANGEVARLSAA
jgi:photosystem II stability/assembly factor-like uncharacterized protein